MKAKRRRTVVAVKVKLLEAHFEKKYFGASSSNF